MENTKEMYENKTGGFEVDKRDESFQSYRIGSLPKHFSIYVNTNHGGLSLTRSEKYPHLIAFKHNIFAGAFQSGVGDARQLGEMIDAYFIASIHDQRDIFREEYSGWCVDWKTMDKLFEYHAGHYKPKDVVEEEIFDLIGEMVVEDARNKPYLTKSEEIEDSQLTASEEGMIDAIKTLL